MDFTGLGIRRLRGFGLGFNKKDLGDPKPRPQTLDIRDYKSKIISTVV